MNALITGGTQGLGFEIAKRLVREGAPNIAISGRNEQKGEEAAKEIVKLGGNCIFIRADVGLADDCRTFVGRTIEAFGSVNALVNSAAATSRGTLLDTSLELSDEHFNTNVRGPFLTMQGLFSIWSRRDSPVRLSTSCR
jgi:NAD(P)-dependent dehydrogenase (short-subunit alcohol dehydrogenase family)